MGLLAVYHDEVFEHTPLKSFNSSFSAFACAGNELTRVFRLSDSIPDTVLLVNVAESCMNAA
jgi:hypothetical protein